MQEKVGVVGKQEIVSVTSLFPLFPSKAYFLAIPRTCREINFGYLTEIIPDF